MTVPGPSPAAPRRELTRRVDDSGLIALEWLLIVGAVAGLAATTVLVVQTVVDDTSEAPPDPMVRLLQADVAAAFVAAEAQAVFDESITNPLVTYNDASYRDLCVVDLAGDFDDVVAGAAWTNPEGPDLMPGTADDVPARCVVTPHPGLGA